MAIDKPRQNIRTNYFTPRKETRAPSHFEALIRPYLIQVEHVYTRTRGFYSILDSHTYGSEFLALLLLLKFHPTPRFDNEKSQDFAQRSPPDFSLPASLVFGTLSLPTQLSMCLYHDGLYISFAACG